MKILVTGGCGYKGHVLVPKLLARGEEVIAFDIQWFGNYLEPHSNLTVIKVDVREIDSIPLAGVDCIIHLSSIANDPCGDLNPQLTWEVSALATMQLADKAKRLGIKRFIYASSGSVYGVKEELQVTEDLELKPISEYNKTKMVAERVLLSYQDDMVVQIIRPATVCGYAPRQRLDVSVNILTNHAVNKNKITVFGGDQLRPNLHVKDYCDAVELFLEAPSEKIRDEIFNIGYQNMAISDIAQLVKKVVEEEFPEKGDIGIVTTPSDDNRSYHINSDKIKRALGFSPKHSIEEAIHDLCDAFKGGKLPNSFEDDTYFNLKQLKKKQAK